MSDNMKIKSYLQDIGETAVSNMHNMSAIKLKLSKTSNMADHLEQQISENIKFTNNQLIAVDKKIADKISDLQISGKQTKRSVNKFAMTLSNLNSTLQLHQNFINSYNKEGHCNLLLHNANFHKFKEKLTSGIKEMLKPDDLT
eukprot:8934060-Ditylum_brightwellii.AAC.1